MYLRRALPEVTIITENINLPEWVIFGAFDYEKTWTYDYGGE